MAETIKNLLIVVERPGTIIDHARLRKKRAQAGTCGTFRLRYPEAEAPLIEKAPNTNPKAVPAIKCAQHRRRAGENGMTFAFYGTFSEAKAGQSSHYCAVCNPFQFQTREKRSEHLEDVRDLFADIAAGALPAVAYVKPDRWLDGHLQTSKLSLFEAFARIERTEAKPELFKDTDIFVTFDEGGRYCD